MSDGGCSLRPACCSVIVVARRSIVDIPTALITIALLWRFKKLQEPAIIAAAAAGLVLYPLMRS